MLNNLFYYNLPYFMHINKYIYPFIILFLLLLFSCNNNNRYLYIEVIDDYDLFNNKVTSYSKPKILEATNDSIAYCIAVDEFYKSTYASKMTENYLKKSDKSMPVKCPRSFHLFTKDSLDISGGYHLSYPNKIKEKSYNKYRLIATKHIN